jgi:hypothetical protein
MILSIKKIESIKISNLFEIIIQSLKIKNNSGINGY